MVNQAQAFITTVQNLTCEETHKELVVLCQKWIDEAAGRLSSADLERVYIAMTPSKYTAGYICVLLVKLNKTKNMSMADLCQFCVNLEDNIDSLKENQVLWIQDIYCRLFQKLTSEFLAQEPVVSNYATRLMAKAILKLTNGSPTLLTNLHSSLFCLSLKGRRFDVAMPFLDLNVIELFLSSSAPPIPELSSLTFAELAAVSTPSAANAGASSSSAFVVTMQPAAGPSPSAAVTDGTENIPMEDLSTDPAEALPSIQLPHHSDEQQQQSDLPVETNVPKMNLDTRCVLTYFYYGGLILAAVERWNEAVRMLEHCICIPAARLSAIVVEAFKKYMLISLLLGRRRPVAALPSYRPVVIARQCVPYCNVYTRLVDIVQKQAEQRRDIALAVENYLTQKAEVFQRDQNYGLMKRLIISYKENAIKRLGDVFMSLHLHEVTRLAHVRDAAETEEIVRRLCYKHRYNVKIDQKTKTFRFDFDTTESEGRSADADDLPFSETGVEKAMREVTNLQALVNEFDTAVRLHSMHVYKQAKTAVGGGGGAGAGGLGGLGSTATSTFNYFLEDEGFQATGSPPT